MSRLHPVLVVAVLSAGAWALVWIAVKAIFNVIGGM